MKPMLSARLLLWPKIVGADVELPMGQKAVGANTPEDPDVHLQTSTAGAAVLAGQVANLLINRKRSINRALAQRAQM